MLAALLQWGGGALLVWLAVGALVAALTGQLAVRHWLYQGFLVLDQLANWLATPWHAAVWADETLSARAWRAEQAGRFWGRVWRPVIDWVFTWQRAEGGHCQQAYQRERARLHLPPELR